MKKPHRNLNALIEAEKYWQHKLSPLSEILHPTTKGNALEEMWRELLRNYLPERYQVSTGFVVSADNEQSDQIDCIIHDHLFTPVLFNEKGATCIPAEAVYAVFEIKPEVTPKNIEYAFEKAKSVRSLHRTSAQYSGDGKKQAPKPPITIIAGLLARSLLRKSWDSSVKKIDDLPAGKLQVVLTANNGSIDYLHPKGEPVIHDEQGGLMLGLLRLLRALTLQGTVPAIDLDEWIQKMVPPQ